MHMHVICVMGLYLTYERQCRGDPDVSTTVCSGSRFRGPKVRASERLCFSLTTVGHNGDPSVWTTAHCNGSRFRGPKVRASERLCFSLTTVGTMETLLYGQPLIAMAQGSEVQK